MVVEAEVEAHKRWNGKWFRSWTVARMTDGSALGAGDGTGGGA